VAYRKRKREKEREKKRKSEKGRKVIVKVSVAKIPVRVTGKSDALSKHRPACTCALSNAYRTAAVFFPGWRWETGGFAKRCFYLCINSKMRKNSLMGIPKYEITKLITVIIS